MSVFTNKVIAQADIAFEEPVTAKTVAKSSK